MDVPKGRESAAPGTFERWLRGFLNEEGNDLLDRTLREHAHELAEKIRALPLSPYAKFTGGAVADAQGAALKAAADLIDPEVTE